MKLVQTHVAAKQLGVTADTIRDWVKAGKLRATQSPGGRWLVDLDSLNNSALRINQAPTRDQTRGEGLVSAKSTATRRMWFGLAAGGVFLLLVASAVILSGQTMPEVPVTAAKTKGQEVSAPDPKPVVAVRPKPRARQKLQDPFAW